MVIVNILFLLVGQTAAMLLGRFYYDQGGNSTWMSTIVQTAAFPLLYIPLIFTHTKDSTTATKTPIAKISIIYIALGVIIALDNLMYSYGLLYLPASTYALVCATQLAFNAVFAYFLNALKFTPMILNSVVLLTFSAALLGIDEKDEDNSSSSNIPKGKYVIGVLLTIGASAGYSFTLSLMQLTFQKVLKKENFSVVLEMQIYTALVATCGSVIGLFASGEYKTLHDEMAGFSKGKVSYIMTLVWTGISWQVASVGVVGLIFMVSSLFSNVISTLAFPVVPVFAVIFFHDKMDGLKVMAMLIAIWGFVSYIYQQYLDDFKAKKTVDNVEDPSEIVSTSC